MKKSIVITSVAVIAILGAAAGWWYSSNQIAPLEYTTVKIGVDAPYPPYEFFDSNGELTGFEVELGNSMCSYLNIKCEWVVTPWDSIIDDLNAGKFDMIMSSMSIESERKKLVDFSDPYYSTPSVYFARKGDFFEGTSVSDLKGKKVAVQSGTLQYKHLVEEYGDNITILTFDGWDGVSASFRSGEADVVLTDYPQWEGEFMLEGVYEVIGEPLQIGDGVGIAFRKSDENLRKAMNKALDNAKTYGDFQRFRRKYFFYDIMVK
ncbi:transporter substrate-binding domain-containing protein [Reinekea marina]|uniref:Transporter substrate-binding domain-containing protein n=1 Tax=Reinekea marina TaxID=1310421 RepID=A0ABV7WSC3_9GAMM|nr:transporter substrate-binding domain-containing protein [Reinekea marina]MDN3647361.1 transporter substrate-binding domain-containing protein [Reinekea marina]